MVLEIQGLINYMVNLGCDSLLCIIKHTILLVFEWDSDLIGGDLTKNKKNKY
jgi:hypothetical protein